jgi:hypothetical protein
MGSASSASIDLGFGASAAGSDLSEEQPNTPVNRSNASRLNAKFFINVKFLSDGIFAKMITGYFYPFLTPQRLRSSGRWLMTNVRRETDIYQLKKKVFLSFFGHICGRWPLRLEYANQDGVSK